MLGVARTLGPVVFSVAVESFRELQYPHRSGPRQKHQLAHIEMGQSVVQFTPQPKDLFDYIIRTGSLNLR